MDSLQAALKFLADKKVTLRSGAFERQNEEAGEAVNCFSDLKIIEQTQIGIKIKMKVQSYITQKRRHFKKLI